MAENKVHWAIPIIFAAICGAYLFGSHGFSVTVPSQVDIVQGSTANTSIIVSPGFFYVGDIYLRAESVPPHVSINFEPQTFKSGINFVSIANYISIGHPVSTLTISADKEAAPGEFWINIISNGSGEELKSKLILKINKST